MMFRNPTRSATMILGASLLLAQACHGEANPLPVTMISHVDIIPDYAKALSEEQGSKILRGERQATQSDAGLISYVILQQTGATNHFTIVETWAGPAAYAKHEGSAHTLKFRRDIQQYLGAPLDSRPHHPFE